MISISDEIALDNQDKQNMWCSDVQQYQQHTTLHDTIIFHVTYENESDESHSRRDALEREVDDYKIFIKNEEEVMENWHIEPVQNNIDNIVQETKITR